MLGFSLACMWFVIVSKIVLKTNNPIKKILNKLQLKNNMSDDTLYSLNFDGEDVDEATLRRLLEISKKDEQLTKIKEDLKKFTSSLEQSEIIKKMNRNEESKKNN